MLNGMKTKVYRPLSVFFTYCCFFSYVFATPQIYAEDSAKNNNQEESSRNFIKGYEVIGTLHLKDLHYETGEYRLTPDQKKYVSKELEPLRSEFIKIIVDAYTDAVGSREANFELSIRRGSALSEYLQNIERFSGDNILVRGHGENFAATGDARDKNSAVESPPGNILDRKVEVTAYILKSLQTEKKLQIVRKLKEDSELHVPLPVLEKIKSDKVITVDRQSKASEGLPQSSKKFKNPDSYFSRVGIAIPFLIRENFSQNSGIGFSFSLISSVVEKAIFVNAKFLSISGRYSPNADLSIRSSVNVFSLLAGLKIEHFSHSKIKLESEWGVGFGREALQVFDDLETTRYGEQYSATDTTVQGVGALVLSSSQFFLDIAPFNRYELTVSSKSISVSIILGLAFRKNS